MCGRTIWGTLVQTGPWPIHSNIGTDWTVANTQQHLDACLFNIIISLNFVLCEEMEILYIPVTVDGSGIVHLYKTIFKA